MFVIVITDGMCLFDVAEPHGHVLHGTDLLRQQVRIENQPEGHAPAQGQRMPQADGVVPSLRQRLHLRHTSGTSITGQLNL